MPSLHVTLVSAWPEDGVPRNGVQVHTVQLARALVGSGATVTHVGFGGPKGVCGGVRLIAVPPPPAGAMTLLGPGLLVEAALETGADLLHVQGAWAPHGLAALRCARQRPTAVTVHGLVAAEAALRFPGTLGALKRAVFAGAERQIAERLPIIAVSAYVRDALGAASARVVPNGVDEALFSLRRRPEPGRILCVAALEPRKGQIGLVEAMALLVHGAETGLPTQGRAGGLIPSPWKEIWTAVLVGPHADPAYAAQLERAIRTHRLGRAVEIRGAVSEAELREELARADALVLPSLEESQGLALLEAMAAGVPAVASDIPGIRCWVAERRAALLVAPGDPRALAAALRRVRTEAALRDALVQAGAALAAEHRWPRVAQATIAIYEELLGRARVAPTPEICLRL